MGIPGGNPPMRPDQAVQPLSRAGVGPAPQTNVFSRIIVVTGTTGGIFIYSPSAGPGNLVGSWTAAAGTDQFGNSFPAGINVTAGVLSGVVINALMETISPGPLIIDAAGDLTVQVFTTPGVNNWTAPAGVTSVQAFVQGPGHQGGLGAVGGFGGGGGGGGEFAFEPAVAVTPATVYHPFVGTAGTASTFAGDAVTVLADSGHAGTSGTATTPGVGGNGGHASTNSVHFNGGKGGNAGSGANSGGGGAGGGASNSQAGNNGQSGPASGAGGLGGATAPGQYPGGPGGAGGVHAGGAGVNGTIYGGGGGGGGDGGGARGSGAQGRVILVYSTLALATFLVAAPAAGTDPATGYNYSIGLTIVDPIFGDAIRIAGANLFLGAATQYQFNNGSVDVITAGFGLKVKEGANCKQGTATLAGGTSGAIANTSVTASSRILLTAQDNNSTGALRVSARVAGTSFTITSSNAGDSGVVAWEIFEPG